MKKLLVIIILNFFFFTQSQSDNIRDFQIENLGIGVSLLEYMTEDEIKDNQFFHPKLKEKDEYIHVNVIKAFETYDAVEVSIKKNDNKLCRLYSDLNIKNNYQNSKTFVGKAGSTFFVDSYGIHKGLTPINNFRLMLNIHFGRGKILYSKYDKFINLN